MQNWIPYVENCSKIIIYGAGGYGNRVLKKLKENGYDYKIDCFCVSDKKDKKNIAQYSTFLFDEIKIESTTLIIISVGGIFFDEIVSKIEDRGLSNWIDGKGIIFEGSDLNKEQYEITQKKIVGYLKSEKCVDGKCPIAATHVTYAYVRNAGDVFLSYCIRRYLGFKTYNIISMVDAVTEKTIESINKTDVLLIGGGGLFLPDTNKNELSGWQWAISNELLQKIKVPIIIYSVGYNFYRGQHQTELFRESVNSLVRKASFVGLRNSGSVQAIREIVDGDLRDKIVFQPCITTITSSFLDINKKKGKGVVALNMGGDRSMHRFQNEAVMQMVYENVAKAMKQIEKKGYKIKYFVHCDVDEDFICFLNQFNIDFEIFFLAGALPQDVQNAYEDVEMVIGMRGHAQMIPFGMGKRIITLSTHDKMRWFLEDADMMECYIDLDDIENVESNIISVFDNIIESEEYINKLETSKQRMFELSEANKKTILEIIKDYKQSIVNNQIKRGSQNENM